MNISTLQHQNIVYRTNICLEFKVLLVDELNHEAFEPPPRHLASHVPAISKNITQDGVVTRPQLADVLDACSYFHIISITFTSLFKWSYPQENFYFVR